MRTHYTLEERYLAKVDVSGPDDCWLWTGGLGGSPYGMLWDGTYRESGSPRMVTATRIGYRVRLGVDPGDRRVLHTCDNPPCHNPNHWFLGSVGDNNRDRHSKGRTVLPDNRGERHGMARLTDRQVGEIRDRYARGDVLQADLATEYGVGQQQISRIVRRQSRG